MNTNHLDSQVESVDNERETQTVRRLEKFGVADRLSMCVSVQDLMTSPNVQDQAPDDPQYVQTPQVFHVICFASARPLTK